MFRLAFLQTNKTFGDTCLVPAVSFLQFFCEICLAIETMLKNIRCFIVFPAPLYAMTTEHGQPKNNSLPVTFLFILPQLFLPPPPPPHPLCNVEMGSDACQELFVTQKTTMIYIFFGGGGGGREANVVVSLFTSDCTWKGNFVIDFVQIKLVGFQILVSLKVSTFHDLCLVAPVVVP